jgi:hypothetical protein
MKDTQYDFINKALKKHSDKYDYSKVIYEKSNKHIIIICKTHGEFRQTPNKHLLYNGCKKCSMSKINENTKLTTEIFINKSKLLHNNIYDYSKTQYGKNNMDKVIIICKIHGDFLQMPNNHMRGAGCIKCSIEMQSNNIRGTTEEFIKKSKQRHGDRYDYSKSIYGKNNNQKICITCKTHGDFYQLPYSHIYGAGCPYCNGGKRYNIDEFVNRAIFLNKNQTGEALYDYSKVIYKNARTKVVIICKKHNIEFLETPDSHSKSAGCYLCKKGKQYSKSQIVWLLFLQKYYNINIQHAENGGEYNIENTKYKADGYCKETNTIYEFHGDLWHGNPKIYNDYDINPVTKNTYKELYEKTIKKELFIKSLGYNLVVIWEYDWKKINKVISKLQTIFRKHHNKIFV